MLNSGSHGANWSLTPYSGSRKPVSEHSLFGKVEKITSNLNCHTELAIFSLFSFAVANFNLRHLACYFKGIAFHEQQPVHKPDNNYFIVRCLYDVWYLEIEILFFF